jgi:hypothetical protein
MKPTTGDSSAGMGYPAPPTVSQPPPPTIPQRIMFNRSYLISITGILRIALIVKKILLKLIIS